MVGVCATFICPSTDRLKGILAVYPQISSPSPTPSLGLEGTSSQAGELLPPSPPAGQEDGPSVLELESLKMGKPAFLHSVGPNKVDII